MSAANIAKEMLQRQADMMARTARQTGSQFEKAYRLVANCDGTVLIVAFGKSGAVGAKMAATFRSAGKRAMLLNPVDALHGEMASVQSNDLAIAVSSTGESDELMRIVPWLKKRKVKLIALTPYERSSLARACDVLIRTQPPHDSADSCASYTSCLSALALGDLLGLCVINGQDMEHQRSAPDERPAEAIYSVADLIETRPQNPTAPENTMFRDALLELTAKGLGAISIVDSDGLLAGILTDGDIRRLLQKSQGQLTRLFLTNVDSVMTKNPKCITHDKTVFDALKLMENNAITVLPVVDRERRPAGMIHLHDLVQMGLLHQSKPAAVKKKAGTKGGGRGASKK